MSTITHFQRMARFNAWVNAKLYDAVAQLPEDGYFGDQDLFFGSVHRTLNHLLLVDRLWTNRMKQEPNGFTDLDEELYGDFASLRAARRKEDEAFIVLVEGLSAGELAREIAYIGTARSAATREHMIGTLLNHQAHHRGQITAILSRHGVATPDLDLIFYLYETGEARSGEDS